jgi:hypothetical protein
MAYPLANVEQSCDTASRRDGHTRWTDALPAHTTKQVLDCSWAAGQLGSWAAGQLGLLVTGRVLPECT